MDTPKLHESKTVEQLAGELLAILADRARARRDGAAPNWIATTELAAKLDIRVGGSKDSRKRGVRVIVAWIDEHRPGVICRSFHGLALAQTTEDLTADQDFRRRMGVGQLAAASRVEHSEAKADATGQLGMFGDMTPRARSPMTEGR